MACSCSAHAARPRWRARPCVGPRKLAPLLFRLQEALAPPASERLAQPALDDALDAVTEIHGAGALDLGALDAGEYGVSLDEADENDQTERDDARDRTAPPPAAVVAALVDAIVEAARARRREASLDTAALTAAFEDVGPAPPPTCLRSFWCRWRGSHGARDLARAGCWACTRPARRVTVGAFRQAALGAPFRARSRPSRRR